MAYIIIGQTLPTLGKVTHGFVGHYTASRLLSQAEFGPQVYHDDWFAAQVQHYTGPSVFEIFTPNLPTVSLLALPLAALPSQLSRDVWIGLSVLALFCTCGVLMRIGSALGQSWERSGWVLLLGVVSLLPAIGANVEVGQTYLFLGLLLALALWGLVYRVDTLLGGALGLAFIIKTSGLFLWIVLLTQRRWRALGVGISLMVAVALASLPWIGLNTWLAYPAAVQAFSQRGALAVTAYQTTAGLFRHLFVYDPVWNPTPVSDWPFLAAIVPVTITLIGLGLTVWLGRGSDPPLFFAALLPPAIILLPVAEEYHFVLLLSSIFVIITSMLKLSRLSFGDNENYRRTNLTLSYGIVLKGTWVGLGVALLLLVAPVPFKYADWASGWWALLAYPRLYGAGLLWMVALKLLYNARFGRLFRGE
ncbi:MAG: DUF2029 domain-containing protein [Anaerolineae bacterium]|nr:DUF2029 domain-containing protein [Anaerolineae bacterium]